MTKLACVLLAASLGGGVMISLGVPYAEAARHAVIAEARAHDVLKDDAHHAVMREALDHPALPTGMRVVLPQPGGERVIARGPAVVA